ncbi:MAG TPA: hypothetical protein ENI33_09605 [Thermoplasmatales archaeon]|nr:hypothetical protein [Thermoplasmatales archaeon]
MKSAIALFLVLGIAMSGCIEEKSTSGIFTKTDNTEEKTIGIEGGNIFFLEYHVYTDFPENAVNNEINITITEVSSYPEKEGIKFMDVYHFEPDGINFAKPVKIGINYDSEEIPENISDEDIKLFMYQSGKWNEIEDSQPVGSYVAGYVSHFCFIASGYSLQYVPNPDVTGERNSSDNDNHSAVWTFEVPVKIREYEYGLSDIPEPFTDYVIEAYIAWDPQPYVRFYQLYFHYNGNEAEKWIYGCDWLERDKNYCHPQEFFFRENTPYYIANEEDYPVADAKGCIYVGELAPNFLDENLDGMHGLRIAHVQQEFKENDGMSEIEKAGIIKEMREYTEEYFEGWTVTVRAVS